MTACVGQHAATGGTEEEQTRRHGGDVSQDDVRVDWSPPDDSFSDYVSRTFVAALDTLIDDDESIRAILDGAGRHAAAWRGPSGILPRQARRRVAGSLRDPAPAGKPPRGGVPQGSCPGRHSVVRIVHAGLAS